MSSGIAIDRIALEIAFNGVAFNKSMFQFLNT